MAHRFTQFMLRFLRGLGFRKSGTISTQSSYSLTESLSLVEGLAASLMDAAFQEEEEACIEISPGDLLPLSFAFVDLIQQLCYFELQSPQITEDHKKNLRKVQTHARELFDRLALAQEDMIERDFGPLPSPPIHLGETDQEDAIWLQAQLKKILGLAYPTSSAPLRPDLIKPDPLDPEGIIEKAVTAMDEAPLPPPPIDPDLAAKVKDRLGMVYAVAGSS